MAIFYFFIFCMMLYGIKFKRGSFFQDYMGKPQCNAIKGIFILVVFMRHVVPYVMSAGYGMPSLLDKVYILCNKQIGQLLVVMFLFYSGYGVMESIKQRGEGYIKSIPKRRFLTTFVNFDIAVSLFLLLDFALDIDVTTEQYFLSRIGWDSVGNSNWYIFIILISYLLTYFSFKLSLKWNKTLFKPEYSDRLGGALLLVVLSLIAVGILYVVKKPHWYNTLLAYPFGFFFSIYKDKFDKIVQERYCIVVIILIVLFSIMHYMDYIFPSSTFVYAYSYNIESIFFALLIVMLTMKVRIGNTTLYWLGANLFPLYIYQRIPMIMIREIQGEAWLSSYPYLFVIITLVGAIVITLFYKYWRIASN